MKKLWISCALALALVALVGLGFMPKTGNVAYASEKAAKSESGHGSSKSGKGEDKDTSQFTYIHLQPLVLPMIGKDGAEQIVTLMIDLQVKDLTVSEKIRQKMPRVQDSILQSLYGGFADGSLRDGDKVDIPKVKIKINHAVETAMGEKLVDAVLIQGVAQRML